MNILEEFYYGNITPYEKGFKKDSQYAVLAKIVASNEEKLASFLNAIPTAKEEQHLFSQLMNAQSEILIAESRQRFIEGFKLGARFILDTFLTPGYDVLDEIYED